MSYLQDEQIWRSKLAKESSGSVRVDALVIPPSVEKALIETYKKHHMGMDNIGWGELGDLLKDAICDLKGHDWFINNLVKEHIEIEKDMQRKQKPKINVRDRLKDKAV